MFHYFKTSLNTGPYGAENFKCYCSYYFQLISPKPRAKYFGDGRNTEVLTFLTSDLPIIKKKCSTFNFFLLNIGHTGQ